MSEADQSNHERRIVMSQQFVNPAPSMTAQKVLFFDFPCVSAGHGVEQPPAAVGSGGYCAYTTESVKTCGNVNLRAPGIEQLYGLLGSPPREQGHPFIKELDPLQPADPTQGIFHDQSLDIDRGFQTDHTGRLSGDFVELLASKPFFSSVVVYATCVSPVEPTTSSIQLNRFMNWLEPRPEAPNVWYWRTAGNNELLFTAHSVINDPSNINGASLQPEANYKLIYQWKFWKYIGSLPYPETPPDPVANRDQCERMGISGFDEAMAFEVISRGGVP
jgi:hypothetical protein